MQKKCRAPKPAQVTPERAPEPVTAAVKPTKRPVGRPATITMAVIDQIGEKIAKGIPEEYSCLLLGVSYPAFQKSKERHPEFVEAIKRKRAEFLDMALSHIQTGLPGWQGHAWILERRHKEHFSKTEITVHNSVENNSFALSESQMDELAQIARTEFCRTPNKISQSGRLANNNNNKP